MGRIILQDQNFLVSICDSDKTNVLNEFKKIFDGF